jgi:hypothetical protein
MLTPTPDDTVPIADEELLYRRLPISMDWSDPVSSAKLSPNAFRPRDVDETGISVVRGHPYNTIEEAARGTSKKGYYIAVLRARDLRQNGIVVVPRPDPGTCGHAEITSINAANRDTDEGKKIIEMLSHKLCLRVEGPFHKPTP